MFLPLEPPPHPPVAVCAVAVPLAFFYVSSQFLVPIWLSLPLYKAVIPTPGYLEELTHHCYRILKPVTVDNMVFYARAHFLPMDCRKSRSSLFSIRSRSNSVWPPCCGGWPSFRGRPLGRGNIPALSLACFRLYRVTHHFTCLSSKLKHSAISRFVFPLFRIVNSSCSIAPIFV